MVFCFLKFKHSYFVLVEAGLGKFSLFLFFSLKVVTQIDNDLKSRASAYNNLKGNLQNLERKNA